MKFEIGDRVKLIKKCDTIPCRYCDKYFNKIGICKGYGDYDFGDGEIGFREECLIKVGDRQTTIK